ncbi:MAG TPA: hypothetical protein DEB44_00020 [Acidimicrobiaceae bacterium]|nr:hypothetical protein [Acidimicrobiaceae bacterium]
MMFDRRFAGGAQRYIRFNADGSKYERTVFLDHRLGCPHLHFGDPEIPDCGCGSLQELRKRDIEEKSPLERLQHFLAQLRRR